MYILGGRNEVDICDLFAFDPSTMKWTEIVFANRVPKPRRRHSAVFISSSLIMFGGFDGEFYNDMHALHINEQQKNIMKIEKSKIEKDFASLINNPTKSDLRLRILFKPNDQ